MRKDLGASGDVWQYSLSRGPATDHEVRLRRAEADAQARLQAAARALEDRIGLRRIGHAARPPAFDRA
jgi:hypothetical protein